MRTISGDDADYVIVRHSTMNEVRLSMLSATDGEVMWSKPVGASGYPGLNTLIVPNLDGDGWPDIYVGSTSLIQTSGQVTLFSGSTGSTIWVANTSYSFVGQLTLVGSSNLAVVSDDPFSEEGAVYLLNGSDGKIIWHTNVENFLDVVFPESSDQLIITRRSEE